MDPLRAQLWLELWFTHSFNRLQNSFVRKEEALMLESEVYQTVVDELNKALRHRRVVIALTQANTKVCKIAYVFDSYPVTSQASLANVTLKSGKQLELKLKEVIDIDDLKYLETQQIPGAWVIKDNFGNIWGWLIISCVPFNSGNESLTTAQIEMQSQLMKHSADLCAATLIKLKHIKSLTQRNQELERTNQIKNQFLANTSHEMGAPLTAIIGFTRLILAQGYNPSSERHQVYFNRIISTAKYLSALINDILDLSKIEANQLEINWEEVNISLLCRNVLTLFEQEAADEGLKLNLELQSEEITIVADRLRLQQVLFNLISNALKFTTSGAIGLKVKAEDELVYFTVWDTGIGIPKQYQAQLFQPYFRIPNNKVSRGKGTGLGLAVTQKLVEIHGGSIEVRSEIDRGSKFTVILPRNQVSKPEET